MQPGDDQAMTGRRLLPVGEAAAELGLTVEAVRSRLKRGTLDKEKSADGTVYVVIEDESTDRARQGDDQATDQANAHTLIVERLENEVQFLRGELQRKDAILLNMTEAMRAITDPTERREWPETDEEGAGKGDVPEEQEKPADRRPWWRKFFGIE